MAKGCDDPSPTSRLEAMISRLGRLPAAALLFVCLSLLVLVAVLDTATGPEVSFSLFYLIPVSAAAVLVSRRVGEALAFLSAITWGVLEVSARQYSAAWIPVWNSAVRLGFFVLVVELIVTVRQVHQRQSELARTDPLTGIPNARVFCEAVEHALARSRRSGEPFSVAYIDLDRFKHVNDTQGHSEGDKILRYVATSMRSALRETDTLARLGGDEFAVLFSGSGDDPSLQALERMRSRVALSLEERWAVGMTVGLVTFLDPPADPDVVVHAADTLMYRGKAAGRDVIVRETWSRS